MTRTAASLSQYTLSFALPNWWPHVFRATTTVSISRADMCSALWAICGGKPAWKYSSPHTPPHPARHAYVANTTSGSLHSLSGIKLTPLYSGRNLWNRFMSALALSLSSTDPHSLVVHNKLSSRDTNTRPCLTHLHTKCSFPSSCCSSFRDAACLVLHLFTSSSVSCTLSGVTSITMATMSKRIPRKTILVAGSQAFKTDSANPSRDNRPPRKLKAHWAFSFLSAPPKSCGLFLTGSAYMVLQGIAPWRYCHWHIFPGGKKDQEVLFPQKHQFRALSSMAISQGQNPWAGSQRMAPMLPPTHTLSSRNRQWLPGNSRAPLWLPGGRVCWTSSTKLMGNPYSRKSIASLSGKPTANFLIPPIFNPVLMGILQPLKFGIPGLLITECNIMLSRTSVSHFIGILGLGENSAAMGFKGAWWGLSAPHTANPLSLRHHTSSTTSSTSSIATVPFKPASGTTLLPYFDCSASNGLKVTLFILTLLCHPDGHFTHRLSTFNHTCHISPSRHLIPPFTVSIHTLVITNTGCGLLVADLIGDGNDRESGWVLAVMRATHRCVWVSALSTFLLKAPGANVLDSDLPAPDDFAVWGYLISAWLVILTPPGDGLLFFVVPPALELRPTLPVCTRTSPALPRLPQAQPGWPIYPTRVF